jgi:hypothetical protein
MSGVSSILVRGPHWRFNKLFVHCPHCFPHPCDLPAAILIATTTFTLSILLRQTHSIHMAFVLVSHNRGPLTFPFHLSFTFGFSGSDLDFSLRSPLLVTLPNLRRSSILSERRLFLILYIQVQEYCLVAAVEYDLQRAWLPAFRVKHAEGFVHRI